MKSIKDLLTGSPQDFCYISFVSDGDEKSRASIGEFVDTITESLQSEFQVHQPSWSDLIIMTETGRIKALMHKILPELTHLNNDKIDNFAVFSVLTGAPEEKIKQIEETGLQIAKIDYWADHIFESYFKNGDEIPLKETS